MRFSDFYVTDLAYLYCNDNLQVNSNERLREVHLDFFTSETKTLP